MRLKFQLLKPSDYKYLSGHQKRVRNLAVSVSDLIPPLQGAARNVSFQTHAVAEAMDKINGKYGEFAITPAGLDTALREKAMPTKP
jgi:hypothetical protein